MITDYLKQTLLKELKDYFGDDKKRINHANKVMQFAEELLKKEKAHWRIVIPASILHDIGIKAAEEKYGSASGHYQEIEGPPVARGILVKLGFRREEIDEICEIIAHHHSPGKTESQNYKLLYDADWLVNLKDEVGTEDRQKLEKVISKVFLTAAGRQLAQQFYLQ